MRAKISHLRSKIGDRLLRGIVQFAGSFFPEVTGVVDVRISDSRRAGRFWGNACGRTVRVCLPPAGSAFPMKLHHGYRRFRTDKASVREAVDSVEVLVWLLGHEMGHVTRRNRRLRRGAQERHSDRCGAELLDAFRERRLQIESEAQELDAEEKTRVALAIAAKPQERLERLEASRARWQSRLKRAVNKLRKLNRQIAAHRRKLGLPLESTSPRRKSRS